MFKYFMPDEVFETVYDIDFNAYKEKKIRGIIFDIDNTLVSYKQEKPTEKVKILMEKLKNNGFVICFVSNNKKSRVDIFNEEFKFFSFPKAGKPGIKYIKKALEVMNLPKENVMLVGDQLFTDVAAAKCVNITAALVKPIEPVETLFFKFKRVMEKPFLKRYYRRLDKKNAKKI